MFTIGNMHVIEVQMRCYFGRNCHVLMWEITHFSDSKYHIVGFIFTDFNMDHTVWIKYVISHVKT